ncbi:ATP-binding protein [Pseudomonas sp. Y39-6]|uniref:ATP-binding protein n=1 Tax=Pseudomonas TaxID=286 RepID=UPI00190FF9DE|nr:MULTISPECIES: ATP-binding protein [Pseudomonas]MCT9826826.1 ATP-binding protein [Pseudomonas veronii]QPO18161.1 ATP-binding protein [Pseudomonas sp. Y39-6]URS61275.1 ATP-binding protein [Pseudomonas sp. Y39-6]
MKLAQIRLRNFRCYKDEVSIDFGDMTALIGRNDAGKSTIMEALDIFFNDGLPDKHDASKTGNAADLCIIAVFEDLPESLVLDQTQPTSLADEYLLNADGKLEIHKVFNGGLEKPKLTNLKIIAVHPTAARVNDLVTLNSSELKARARELNIPLDTVDQRVNSQLRAAIRSYVGDLALDVREITLAEGNGVSVWKGMQAQMPSFALFKSDRASTDQDPEAQDPLNAAIKEAVRQKEPELNAIAIHIEAEVRKIAELTLKKLQEMDPSLASSLTPNFPPPKWANLFKASITGDDDIPINKRGSGVRRLILLNFFRAKSEQLIREQHRPNAIYAIEEPETSQHPRNQRLLISALQEITGTDQVILTTHTPMLARALPASALRFITKDENNQIAILNGGEDGTNVLIAKSLGVLPDHNVKIFIGVEGKHDISFLKNMSTMLIDSGSKVPDLNKLELEGELIFTPLGGSALALWCNRLANLNRPEFHIYDRDDAPPSPPKYQRYIEEVNRRNGCLALATNKREMENYIHLSAINLALNEAGIATNLDSPINNFDDVPSLLFRKVNEVVNASDMWGQGRAKEFLCNSAIKKLTIEMLRETDTNNEILGWFDRIAEMLETQN